MRIYLWRCEGCGALWATEEPNRSFSVPLHHGDASYGRGCGHAVEPFCVVDSEGGGFYEKEDEG